MRRVYKLDKATMEVLAEYRSIVDAARRNAVPLDTVRKCCRFRGAGREEHLFRYADDYDENERYREAQYGRPVLRIDVETGDAEVCVGIAADEPKRVKDGKRYPLVEYGVTETQALEYCYGKGYDWGGLYEQFDRVSCYCCPLQPINELRLLRKNHPELWDRLMLMDAEVNRRPMVQQRFRDDYDLPELEMRFRREDRQMSLNLVD